MLHRYLRTAIKLGSQQTVNDDIIDTYRDNSFYQTNINVYNDQSFYKHQYNLIKDNMIHNYSFQLSDKIVAQQPCGITDSSIKNFINTDTITFGDYTFKIIDYQLNVSERTVDFSSQSLWEQGSFSSAFSKQSSTDTIRLIEDYPIQILKDSIVQVIAETSLVGKTLQNEFDFRYIDNSTDNYWWYTGPYTVTKDVKEINLLLTPTDRSNFSPADLTSAILKITEPKPYNLLILNINSLSNPLNLRVSSLEEVYIQKFLDANQQPYIGIFDSTGLLWSQALDNEPLNYLDNTIYELKDININESENPIYVPYSEE